MLYLIYFKVARFAREVVQPKVQEMDEAELMDSNIIKLMFENGVSHSLSLFILFCIHEKKFMGLETESDYGGAECSFTAAILAVEGM